MTGPAAPAPPDAGLGYLRALREKFFRLRVPAAGSIELTHRCNLSCIHCYLSTAPSRAAAPPRKELSAQQWCDVLGQAAEAGCLDLLVTGGEPLLRPDFGEIYRRAKELGMLVTVFTNGTLISERILDLLADLPPQQVEVSLYGATAVTCDAVTGVGGSFKRAMAGIRGLVDRGVPTALKTMALTVNLHEMKDLERLAAGMGLPFRLDAALFPCSDGNRAPLQWRIGAAEAAELEFGVDGLAQRWCEHYGRMKDAPAEKGLIPCGAGATAFCVDPTGILKPCQMMDEPIHDLLKGSFRQGWEEAMAGLRDTRPGGEYLCGSCGKRSLCGLCPAVFKIETGRMDRPSPYLCALAEERYQRIVEAAASSTGVKEI